MILPIMIYMFPMESISTQFEVFEWSNLPYKLALYFILLGSIRLEK